MPKRDAAVEAVFEPVRRPTTFEETVERLGTAIRLGLLAPGARLPPERDLADQLGIARSTLRQALTTLTQSGHLTSVRGRTGGTFVADAPPMAEGGGGPALEGRWRDLLDFRVAVECGAALLAAERAIERHFDEAVAPELRRFFYLPFMHAEDLAAQERSVALNEALGEPDSIHWARHHRDVIARFGRFPHRNAILGRASSADEQAFLQQDRFSG